MEVSIKVGDKSGSFIKAEINGLDGVKNTSIREETVNRDGTTAVVEKKAEIVCPDGKLASPIWADDGTYKLEESTKKTAYGEAFAHYVEGGV